MTEEELYRYIDNIVEMHKNYERSRSNQRIILFLVLLFAGLTVYSVYLGRTNLGGVLL